MKNIIGNFWTFTAAVVILPLVYGIGAGFFNSLILIKTMKYYNPALIYFLCGAVSYAAFQIIFSNPIRMYVFGHELTHAIAGILSGGRVKSFTVGKNGGSVTLTKAGFFATLAPYFVPVYSLILIFIYIAAGIFFKQAVPRIFPYFMFLFGASIAFHISLTVFAVSQGQTDLKRYGIFFSIVVVLIFNILILESILAIFFKAPVGIFFKDLIKYTGDGYSYIYNFGVKLKCLTQQTPLKQ